MPSLKIKALVACGRRDAVVAFYIVIVLLVAVRLDATQSNYRLCFTQVVGLPITNPNQPPTIDGTISGDPGWTQSFRYVYGNGTAFPSAAVQGIKDDSFLYLSVEVNNDVTYDNFDVVVLYFSPSDGGSSTTEDRRLVIYPNRQPLKADYWKDRATWGSAGTTPPASVSIARSQDATHGSWSLEIKIPLTGPDSFNIPATTNFGLYWDVIRVNNNTGAAVEYTWPSNIGNGLGQGNEETSTKPPADWGNATLKLGETCNGIRFDWPDIVSNTPPDQIDARPGNANNFTATLHNNSVKNDGTPVAANQITAKFSVANFGLPSNWTPILGSFAAQTQGAQNIPAGTINAGNIIPGTASITSAPNWTITSPSDINNYKTHPDQCILVDLDTLANAGNPPNCNVNPESCVTFVNQSVKRNMWVLTTSEVSKTAEISAKGYGPPPPGQSHQEFALHVLSKQEVLTPNQKAMSTLTATPQAATATGGYGKRVVSRLTWAVDGCRLTGQYIIIAGKRFDTCEDVGAFGAIVEHFGAEAVHKWKVTLDGPGLSRDERQKDAYRLSVPVEGVADVAVHFAPQENDTSKRRFALFLDAGGNFPQGTFGTAFNNGFSLNAGLEYIATSHLSLEGIFGYHRFPANSVAGAIVSDLNVYQFSANAKTYLTTGTVQPFINGGIGGYRFSAGSGSSATHFGGNVGAGVLFNLTSQFGLQGSYNFHAVNTPGEATKFSTLQGGIRFVF